MVIWAQSQNIAGETQINTHMASVLICVYPAMFMQSEKEGEAKTEPQGFGSENEVQGTI